MNTREEDEEDEAKEEEDDRRGLARWIVVAPAGIKGELA